MIGIVVSRADEASEHVGDQLLSLREWTRQDDEGRPDPEGGGTVHRSGPFALRTFDDLHLHLEGVAGAFDDPALVVFASRHSGETGRLLTAHFTGNLGPAEYGGDDYAVADAAPAALDRMLAAFEEHAPAGYETGIECTHHGPTDVGAPSLFVELGSGPNQWEDTEAARAVARSILALEGLGDPTADRTLVGLGGGHYAKRFERVLQETDWAVGHVAADWGLDAIGDPGDHRDLLAALFEASGAERALVDGDHPALGAAVEAAGYDCVGETWVRAVDGVALDLVAAAEAALSPVEDGLRFGDPAVGYQGAFAAVALPDQLLEAARGVDREATRAAVEEHLLAYETDEGASKATGGAAVVDAGDRSTLVDALAAVLETTYDSVERDGETVVVRERGFDPALARELGVPEGPKFGRLAADEPVEVDGETVAPEEVTAERVRSFPVR